MVVVVVLVVAYNVVVGVEWGKMDISPNHFIQLIDQLSALLENLLGFFDHVDAFVGREECLGSRQPEFELGLDILAIVGAGEMPERKTLAFQIWKLIRFFFL